MSIRRAEHRDVSVLAHLGSEVHQLHVRAGGDEFRELGPEDIEPQLAQALDDPTREQAREGGFDRLVLDVWSFNENARGFFVSEGFAPLMERMELRVEV